MPAVWFDDPLANALFVVLAAVVVLGAARRLIIHAAGPDEKGGSRRPGSGALANTNVCPNGDCAAPNRPDALYCRRCGTRIDGRTP